MELHRITSDGITKYVLVDDTMHLVHPVNRYLEYLRLQGRAECTIKSYGYDLKAFFVFLQRKGLTYGAANASMIQEYVEYLRSSHEDMIEIYVKSARTGSTINRMIGTLYGFCCYLASVKEGTKTQNGNRDVPISRALAPYLREALERQKPNKLDLLFCDRYSGKPLRTSDVSNYFGRICKKAHIEPRGQHALRHTFATRCIEAGIPPVVLKKWLGHSDIHITLDTYTDVFSELNDGSVNLLDDYLKNL